VDTATGMTAFKDLSIDDKLIQMWSKLITMDELKESVHSLKATVETTVSDMREIKHDIKEFDLKLKTLEYKAIDSEARSRRNNLLFWGVPETNNSEDCEESVLNIVRGKLEMDSEKCVVIQRAHRVGMRHMRSSLRDKPKPRPIVACFRDSKDVDIILGNTFRLKQTDIGISRDYPKPRRLMMRTMPFGQDTEKLRETVRSVFF
jgi:hypothetical protein